ncbi:diguanylate cyclase [Vibrio pectenicida]|uniref:diguanylate cyclase n=1 Tax=Vibrio pectenicida TaxID=62763 RepID=A0A3R9EBV8_9VIBR|nr:diguanylate cyclase [Vibrio pectenicida]
MRSTLRPTLGFKLCVHLGILITLVLVSFAILVGEYREQKRRILVNYSVIMESKVRSSIGVYNKFSHYVYQQITNNDEVIKLLSIAVEGKNDKRDEARIKLYQLLKSNYQLLRAHNFRQLHFHLPNGDSFLRVHKPEKYGDNLFSIRESVRLANTQQKIVEGFEEGRIFNGYRFVYPVSKGQQALGSVEVSLSMGSIVDLLVDLYPRDDFQFIISQNAVDSKLFKDMKNHYIPSILADGYYYDKAVFEKHLRNVKHRSLIDQAKNYSSQLKPLFDKKESFSQAISLQDQDYIISFLSIKNFKNEHVAYLISSSRDNLLSTLLHNYATYLILIVVVSLFYIWNIYSEFTHKKELTYLSSTDFLTKLANRNKFTEHLHFEHEKSKNFDSTLSIIIFDIDHFKKINDELGHNAGDDCLKELSELVSKKVRHTDILARWGGEEFIILLPETPEESALKVAEAVRKAIESNAFSLARPITVSLGVAESSSNDTNVEQVIARADEALYASKNDGRNRSSSWYQIQAKT